ncbi:hypothetical protein [Alkalihalobacillus pseudalcaliphilus]|uniref:hypothetical protein n=1 Tax=Alkalihalobacillus pseudalcaliphilus TaxID=79884 RepID=UPI00064DFDDE|nr:hypothetical protein [Alkalihalobacillus pseudalcaliphilus]KMK77621.1 hypothetical protein AB990_03940 [Alkalihalobacillus pseudalcaliphilus]
MLRRPLNPIHDVFNDGFLEYGRNVPIRERGKQVGSTFAGEGVLAFQLMSARDEDYQLAGTLGATLDLKIKTRFPPHFKDVKRSKLAAVIDKTQYDIFRVDWDSKQNYLFFLLQEVGPIE